MCKIADLILYYKVGSAYNFLNFQKLFRSSGTVSVEKEYFSVRRRPTPNHLQSSFQEKFGTVAGVRRVRKYHVKPATVLVFKLVSAVIVNSMDIIYTHT